MAEQFMDPNIVLFGKLALAAFLGLIIGSERAIVGKQAGTRTFALVSLGACLFVVTSIQATNAYLGLVNFDPMRVAAAVISGIGFLGAGLIIFREDKLRGLTTAAGLWVSAGVGIAVGVGFYAMAVFATVMTLVIFTVVWFLEEWLKRAFHEREPVVVDSGDSEEPGEEQ